VSLPAWGEWIEINYIRKNFFDSWVSLPAWGEWIEIFSSNGESLHLRSLSPHGESGLKSDYQFSFHVHQASLPAWGEWIEIVSP